MLGYLIVLFTLVPVIELALLIKVGQYIGASYTIAIVIITGVTGAYLARLQGIITFGRIIDDINQGRMPTERLFDGMLILCSGILLITPGFITDVLGFTGLIPYTRNILKLWLKRKIGNMISQGKIVRITPFNYG